MKKIYFVFLFLLWSIQLQAQVQHHQQQCNLQGIVKYEYNDHVGYMVDVGAEIGIVPVSKAVGIIFPNMWKLYEDLASRRTTYVMWKNDDELVLYSDDNLRYLAKFTSKDESLLNETAPRIMSQYVEISQLFEYLALVDSSGKYSVTLPYGEYYIVVKSASRKRDILPELTGRLLLRTIKIDRPAKIESFEFSY